ncbi:uncharacterized protein LOC121258672 [Juglans microcarpa x Juglans regia]|uniref:uncharacterized protein LOC121258672 n=1 Tax=Juglans microcarpa x Juglans regia TaxID=2249226 RepID=UPI001B7E9068|nr:uncharacterized protein LOC121258672 [Juglans microcarpa x Juglans regia]
MEVVKDTPCSSLKLVDEALEFELAMMGAEEGGTNKWCSLSEGEPEEGADKVFANFLPVVGNHKLLVQDLWDGVGWKYDEVRPLVDEYMFQKITLSNVRVREGNDMLVWKHTVDEAFTTKSAWQIIIARSSICPWKKWLWQDHVSKKMSFLCWLACQNAIPVDTIIQQLGSLVVSKCHCCMDNKVETVDHVLCDGEGSRKALWYYSYIDFLGYLENPMYGTNVKYEFESKVIIRMIKGLLADISGSMRMFRVVREHDLGVLRELNCPVVPPIVKNLKLITWAPPTGDFSKLNADGGSLGNPGMAGGGGVVRDVNM